MKGEKLIERLKAGETIALVSDAGTPIISDPGYPLLRGCIAAEIPIVPIPGGIGGHHSGIHFRTTPT